LVVDGNRYERFIKPLLGEKEPHELLPLDIERLRRELQKTNCTLRGEDAIPRTLSPATIRATLTLLNRICNYGAKNGLCAALPFKIAMPKVSGVTIEDLNEEELKRLISAIEADTNADARGIMLLALYTGMRRGELFKLKWEDIDFDRGFIRIVGPKGGSDQTIPLNAAARKVLAAHPRTSAYVFPGDDGGQRVTIQKAVRRIRAAAGLPDTFRPLHGLRHAFASRLASSGQVDMYTLQKLLTHKSPVMTQRYAHLRDESLRRASELAGTLVDEAVANKEKSAVETVAASS
jgi:integrase